VDLHAHTRHSHDAWTSPRDFVRRAAAVRLDRVAVTDHGTLRGALEARDHDPSRVIVGEEIRCAEGVDLIGLFIARHIPDGSPASDTAQRIREQGGVVYAPHPFAYLVRPRWKASVVLALADVVEVFNARAFVPSWNRDAAAAAREHGLPAAGSSDAHFVWEIGRARTCLPRFTDAAGFRAALADARPCGSRLTSPLVHAGSIALHALRLGRRRHP
jgi:predicted metal-dependent phosphoesterase TrpH